VFAAPPAARPLYRFWFPSFLFFLCIFSDIDARLQLSNGISTRWSRGTTGETSLASETAFLQFNLRLQAFYRIAGPYC